MLSQFMCWIIMIKLFFVNVNKYCLQIRYHQITSMSTNNLGNINHATYQTTQHSPHRQENQQNRTLTTQMKKDNFNNSFHDPQQSQFDLPDPSHKHMNTNEANHTEKNIQNSDKQKQKSRDYKSQNRKLRIANRQLKRQLQNFQKKLDETLKKKVVTQKKPRFSQEKVQNMELQNAYKQCDNYRRQVMSLRKKQAFYNEQKMDELQNQLLQMQRERQQFLQQIKGLKRTIKQQQKGLVEVAGPNIPKIMQQNEHLKQQNRKLHQKVLKEEQDLNLVKVSQANEKRKQKKEMQKNQEFKKKNQVKEESQLEVLKNKAGRDNQKIARLEGENKLLRQKIQQMKLSLADRDKQCNALRERLASMRKQMKDVKKVRKIQTQPAETPSENDKNHKRLESNFANRSGMSHRKQKSQIQINNFNSQKSRFKYPRLVQAGQKCQQNYKWNHHQFSSKIKQIQVCPHPRGFVKQINFRYEKGQPNRLSKNQYALFACEGNGQFISQIEGGMKDGLLRYLKVKTNKGRVSNFCQHQLEGECKKFVFGNENEYPGAFFGQNSTEGISRIGCLLEQLKQ